VNDILEALNAPCGDCGGVREVTWCAAWDGYPSQAAMDAAFLATAAEVEKRSDEEEAGNG
jgi:hypothetical protein